MTPLKYRRVAALALLVLSGAVAVRVAAANPIEYPATPRGPVTDDYFGTTVADPFRWLEADVRNSDSVATWVEAQDGLARDYLAAIPQRPAIGARIRELYDYERQSAPTVAGGRYFYTHNDGLQNQSVIMVQDGPDAAPRVLFDPNALSADGTTALAGWSVSDDGRWLAWGVSQGGTDWQEWRVRNVDTIQDELGTTQWLRYSGVSWKKDNSGYYYSRYDAPPEGTKYTGRNKFHKVYFHKVGTNQSKDVLIYQNREQPEWLIHASSTEDGRWLVLSITMGGPKNRLLVQDLSKRGADPVSIIDDFTASYAVIGNDGPLFHVKTDDEAPRGRVVTIDVTKPARENWTTIVPEATDALRSAAFAGDDIYLSYLKDASSEVRVVDRQGKALRTLELPGIGVATGLGARRKDTENFYTFTSFTVPPTIYRIDLATGESRVWRETTVDFDPADYEVRREFVTSTDGARVPLFLAHRKGLRRDGTNATLLYVYGGFNQPQTPSFTVSRLAWMEMGGVFALVCARGGGEYGRDWHQAAVKLNKQKTFDDVIAAGEWLINNRYATPATLGLQGGSNGGMVVGAVTNQRPDLFGAVLAQAGVMDMLRYQQFTIGRAWSADYGLSENEDEFQALYAYSPYHNVRPGTRYPAILVTTSDFDDRVVPGHSFKYAAALQAAQAGSAPILVRISRSTGHTGRMKPTALAIEESADLWAFLALNLKMRPRS